MKIEIDNRTLILLKEKAALLNLELQEMLEQFAKGDLK